MPLGDGWSFMQDPDLRPRMETWIRASCAMGTELPFMMVTLQGLGRLDCSLIAEEKRFSSLSEKERATINESDSLSVAFFFSSLWVLGSYEAIRTIDARINGKTSPTSDAGWKLRRAKQDLQRVRVPLAKMEPATKFAKTDSGVAYPGLASLSLEVGWALQQRVFITRRLLSDRTLDALLAVRGTK